MKPVPSTIYKTSLAEIEGEKAKRREETKEKVKEQYGKANSQPFEFETQKRPVNLPKIKEEVEKKRAAEMRKVPDISKAKIKEDPNAEVKLNVAAILKEEAIIKAKQKQAEEKMKNFEMNMRDSAEFEEWKSKQRDQSQIEQIEHQQRKKIEMEIAREAGMKAFEEKIQKNKENAVKMKEISQQLLDEREQKIREDWDVKKNLIDGVLATRGNVEKIMTDIVEEKKKEAAEFKEELREARERKKIEDQELQKKRIELIKQIREMEKQPIPRTKGFDPTETMGLGLLEEMSLVELRERMVLLKQMKEEEREAKKQENIAKKDEFIDKMKDKVDSIQKNREAIKRIRSAERSEKIAKLAEEKRRKEEFRQKSLLEVYDKIQDKKDKQRDEKDRIAKELREINLKRHYLNANQAMIEEKAWAALEHGAEREILVRQNNKLINQERLESIKLKERTILTQAAKTEIADKVEELRNYDIRLNSAKKANEILYREERAEKQRKHSAQVRFEEAHTRNMEESNPYKTKISQQSLMTAKARVTSAQNLTNNKGAAGGAADFELPPPRYETKRPDSKTKRPESKATNRPESKK